MAFLPIIYYGTVIHMLQNHWVGYPDTTRGNILVSQHYHDNADKNFLKFYSYIKAIRGDTFSKKYVCL